MVLRLSQGGAVDIGRAAPQTRELVALPLECLWYSCESEATVIVGWQEHHATHVLVAWCERHSTREGRDCPDDGEGKEG